MLIRENFVAGVPKRFDVVGNFFRIKKATGTTTESVDVTFRRGSGTLNVDLTKSDAGDYAFIPEGYDSITVESLVDQELTLQVARGQVGSNNVLGTTVSVVEGGRARSISQNAFAMGSTSLALAANFSHVVLWNPVGSGKRIVLTELTMLNASGANVNLRTFVVAPTTLIAQAPVNKFVSLAGAVASIAQIRTQQAAAVLGIDVLNLVTAGANQVFVWRLSEPWLLHPGTGIGIAGGVNETVRMTWQWFEEVI